MVAVSGAKRIVHIEIRLCHKGRNESGVIGLLARIKPQIF
jgi:hypothetical protein